eukprot:169333_1
MATIQFLASKLMQWIGYLINIGSHVTVIGKIPTIATPKQDLDCIKTMQLNPVGVLGLNLSDYYTNNPRHLMDVARNRFEREFELIENMPATRRVGCRFVFKNTDQFSNEYKALQINPDVCYIDDSYVYYLKPFTMFPNQWMDTKYRIWKTLFSRLTLLSIEVWEETRASWTCGLVINRNLRNIDGMIHCAIKSNCIAVLNQW